MRAAEVLRPYGILLATAAGGGWTERTKEVAREVLGPLPAQLRFVSCPPPVGP